MQYNLTNNNGHETIVVLFEGVPRRLEQADSNHPNFSTIKQKVLSDDNEGLFELFDPAFQVSLRFEKLSSRVSVAGGKIYLDGDVVHNTLTEQIVRFQKAGQQDWQPLVNFYENLLSNPSAASQESLYNWLQTHNFTITNDGMVVGYKGVDLTDDGVYMSKRAGNAVVNGEPMNGYIPNMPGAVVEMPRSQVCDDTNQGCAAGLHVGTWDYASSWGNGVVLEVHVNPRDAVSVPSREWNKFRVCRYAVVDRIGKQFDGPVRPMEDVTSAEQLV